MTLFDRFSDPCLVKGLAERIAALDPGRGLRFMHVCGTHENAIARYGIRELLPPWVEVIAGPGCPVCICPPTDIDLAVRLALEREVTVTTFGDMLKVPARISLEEARSRGADVRVVYSIADAVALARREPQRQVVFFAVGFETTAVTTAAALAANPPDNFSIVPSHRLIPPAIVALLSTPGVTLDGYVLPGHVLTVAGTADYEAFQQAHPSVALAVAGFEPVDLVNSILRLVEIARAPGGHIANTYSRAVRREGNPVAIRLMQQVFQPEDASWRGIGVIPGSGLGLAPEYARFDARARFQVEVDHTVEDIKPGCRCDRIMLGLQKPTDCPLFGRACRPESPYGPCMVSMEGTCRVWHRYRGVE
jgi:hydrogenase expression/formation protein HypD